MNKLRNIIVLLFLLIALGLSKNAIAQQDPQYSQYMFNQMVLNPAYAGSKDAINAAVFLRSQWTGVDGAPNTQTLSIHGPTRKRKVGLGFALVADQIGPKSSIGVMASYAYRIQVGSGKLAFGIRAGVYQYVYNWNEINYKDQGDIYNTQNRTSTIVPTADAGLYYHTRTFYAGLAATHLYNGRLTTISNLNGDNAHLSPHLILTVGKGWEINDKLTFNPSIVVKAVKSAPINADINFSFLIQKKLWVGASIRSDKSLVAYTQFYATEKFKIGYAFDFGFSKIARVGRGSHEIMLGYDFNIKKSKMLSPRHAYF
jgi:type IX secretion system PorP/SprF family membrane protein